MEGITVKDIFKKGGILSTILSNYEYRESQLQMALKIYDAIKEEYNVIIEAGTGTGKSFAYLIPLIFYSLNSKKPAVVSTNTKALQFQMINKDLPFLKRLLSRYKINFNFEVFYGSNNYICLNRLNNFLSAPIKNLFLNDKKFKWLVKVFEYNNFSGIRKDLPFSLRDEIWKKINRDSLLCLKNRCPFYESCFYYKNFKKLFNTNIIIVNHHLFFANIASNYKLLPEFSVVVLDEAHNIEDIATNFLANIISEYEINSLLDIMYNIIDSEEVTNRELIDIYKSIIKNIKVHIEKFFDFLREKYKNSVRIKEEKFDNKINHTLNNFLERVKEYSYQLTLSEDNSLILEQIFQRLIEIKGYLGEFIEKREEDKVYWIDRDFSNKYITMKFSPINISSILKERVFNFYKTTILTSATLSTNKNFNFIKNRIGIANSKEYIFESEFDYKKQVMLYINKNIPSPSEDFDKYINHLSNNIIKLLNISEGRAFVLFTSYKALKLVKDNLILEKIPYKILVQGEESIDRLIEEFKKDISSVLLGTLSFWEGVDIPGESLSLVIITRLPFEVPDDPITSARIEYIKRNKGNSFFEYQLPNAAILLKQGFGRLIRNRNDKGVVAILDSRIITKSYGKYFFNTLPEVTFSEDMNEISKWLKEN